MRIAKVQQIEQKIKGFQAVIAVRVFISIPRRAAVLIFHFTQLCAAGTRKCLYVAAML